MNFYALSALVNLTILIPLSVILYLKRKESRMINYFNIYNIFIIGWSLGYFLWQMSGTYSNALFWVRFLMFSAMWIAPAFFHFSAVVADKENQLLSWIIGAYMLNIPFAYLNFTSPLFISGLSTKMGINFFPSAGYLFIVFLIFWIFWLVCGFIELFKARKFIYEPKQKEFLKVITISSLVAILAGSVNYFLWFNIPIPPITTMVAGVYGVVVCLFLLRKETYKTDLIYFYVLAGLIVVTSTLNYVFGQKQGISDFKWLTIGFLIFAGLIMASFNRRHYKKLKQKEENIYG
ncbi:MAG: histidine kinase N-terminal 7TM domain-containing protein [Candidatus Magasanikbacteria bacterium]